jgi:hypothetical protein
VTARAGSDRKLARLVSGGLAAAALGVTGAAILLRSERLLMSPALALVAGVCGGVLAARSVAACRWIAIAAIATSPLLLMVLFGRGLVSGWIADPLPSWTWSLPVALLATGVGAVRTSRRARPTRVA